VHDGIELEDRGIATVPLHTEVFMNSAAIHAMAFGRPDFPSVSVQHPVAGQGREAIRGRAEKVVEQVVRVLTGGAAE
jgi:hypothetical protein